MYIQPLGTYIIYHCLILIHIFISCHGNQPCTFNILIYVYLYKIFVLFSHAFSKYTLIYFQWHSVKYTDLSLVVCHIIKSMVNITMVAYFFHYKIFLEINFIENIFNVSSPVIYNFIILIKTFSSYRSSGICISLFHMRI